MATFPDVSSTSGAPASQTLPTVGAGLDARVVGVAVGGLRGCGHGPRLRLDARPEQALFLGSPRISFPHPVFISCSPPQDYSPGLLGDSSSGHSGPEPTNQGKVNRESLPSASL